MYKKAVASFWTVEEVDLSQDMRDWENLSGAMLGGPPVMLLVCMLLCMHCFEGASVLTTPLVLQTTKGTSSCTFWRSLRRRMGL